MAIAAGICRFTICPIVRIGRPNPTPRPCISCDEGSPLEPTERRSRPREAPGRLPGRGTDQRNNQMEQPRALGRKVSDEFTVPLCRAHHHELHRQGNERAWWANLKIEPLRVAHDLW